MSENILLEKQMTLIASDEASLEYRFALSLNGDVLQTTRTLVLNGAEKTQMVDTWDTDDPDHEVENHTMHWELKDVPELLAVKEAAEEYIKLKQGELDALPLAKAMITAIQLYHEGIDPTATLFDPDLALEDEREDYLKPSMDEYEMARVFRVSQGERASMKTVGRTEDLHLPATKALSSDGLELATGELELAIRHMREEAWGVIGEVSFVSDGQETTGERLEAELGAFLEASEALKNSAIKTWRELARAVRSNEVVPEDIAQDISAQAVEKYQAMQGAFERFERSLHDLDSREDMFKDELATLDRDDAEAASYNPDALEEPRWDRLMDTLDIAKRGFDSGHGFDVTGEGLTDRGVFPAAESVVAQLTYKEATKDLKAMGTIKRGMAGLDNDQEIPLY
jgi:hypothetical protein